MALSIGYRNSVSFLPAIQATGRLTFAPVGLSPTEHASLRWTRAFPPHPPQAVAHRCSDASQVLHRCTTPRRCTCGAYRSSLSPTGPRLSGRGRRLGLSVLARGASIHAWGLRLRRVAAHLRYRTPPCCLPVGVTPSAPRIPVFGAQHPACIYPCPMLRVQPHDCPRMARGQDGSLRLSCMTLSFTTPRRLLRKQAHRHPDSP